MSDESDEESIFEEKTAVTGGIRSIDDYRKALQLVEAGQWDEALFTFRLSREQLEKELVAWKTRDK